MHLKSRDVSVFEASLFEEGSTYLSDKLSQIFPNLQKNMKIRHKFSGIYVTDKYCEYRISFNNVRGH